ncbi:3'(2'),5'-bisphosphate nucleotidase CysQ [Pseudoxanthobacter sp.]|uniref:3'(2'),5'-bisphosphate nucleotidase CysQ n=1 Tax=Pseudoxanthobacter sp. TaxID=1925742 RepID=UPI002FE04F8A
MPDADATAAADLDLLAHHARRAGEIALRFFRHNPTVWTKGDTSPVSEADLAVDRYLGAALAEARPGYGWLSEETGDDGVRLSRARVFVVDPIDGTRAFIAGSPDWTISLAVVEEGRPVAAALYCPVRGEMFRAVRGGGADVDGARLAVSPLPTLSGARIAAPRVLGRRSRLAEAGVEEVPFIPSLAYRLALVAAGRIDGAAARGRACDWDLAAADLLIEEAGGALTDFAGRAVRYNRADVRHAPLIAAGAQLRGPLMALFSDLDPAGGAGAAG